jgi:hypothetical protein
MDDRTEDDLMYIYEWVDSIPLSKPKKSICRDFADGVLMAEIIKYHIPKLVDIHNYPSTNSSTQKLYNWNTLNTKVLKKLGINLNKEDIDNILQYKPLAVESLLKRVYEKIKSFTQNNNNALNQSANNNNYDNYNNKENVDKRTKNQNQASNKRINSGSGSDFQSIINEKDAKIEELRTFIEILEMKLKNSEEIQSKLSNRVKELTDKLRSSGMNI